VLVFHYLWTHDILLQLTRDSLYGSGGGGGVGGAE